MKTFLDFAEGKTFFVLNNLFLFSIGGCLLLFNDFSISSNTI